MGEILDLRCVLLPAPNEPGVPTKTRLESRFYNKEVQPRSCFAGTRTHGALALTHVRLCVAGTRTHGSVSRALASTTGQHIINYESAYHNIWIRDAFLLSDPGTQGAGSQQPQPKHVSNPDSVIKKFKPHSIYACFFCQASTSGRVLSLPSLLPQRRGSGTHQRRASVDHHPTPTEPKASTQKERRVHLLRTFQVWS